jgi:hypothetical protein
VHGSEATALSVGDAPRSFTGRPMTDEVGARPVLRLQPSAPLAPRTGRRVVVTDTTWSRGPSDQAIALRDVADGVLAGRDFIVETSALLDAWAEASRIADLMTVDGTSFWYRDRLGTWLWLQETGTWLAIMDALVAETAPGAIEVAAGVDEGLAEAAGMVAQRDGIPCTDERPAAEPLARFEGGDPDAMPAEAEGGPPAATASRPRPPAAARSLTARLRARFLPDQPTRRARLLRRRIADLAAERPHRLAVILAAAPQRVDTPDGPRLINAYLGPIVDRLHGTSLEPVEIELRTSYLDDAGWDRLTEPGAERRLPGDVLRLYPRPDDSPVAASRATKVIAAIARISVPVPAAGVDLGPALVRRVVSHASRTLRGQVRAALRAERVLRDLRPAGLLLADEYHRQDWVGAAAKLRIPSAAVQHGLIYDRHNGYAHRSRPDGLRLPRRTYVFGAWERALLTERSVYRPDEVVTGGSPRLALVDAVPVDRDAVRAELGIAPGERLLVVSGTWGSIYRRFHYPIALARIMDRTLPGVHVVIKLHPAEPDEGPYRAVIEGAAAARGILPPPITVVQRVDLYRLLAASDAHLGVHSTVLTEAVAAGTLNLLADTLAGSDLLGYVAAGVAVPVRDGGDVLDALARREELLPDEAARWAFLDEHFEPGDAAGRIAEDLVAWLA